MGWHAKAENVMQYHNTDFPKETRPFMSANTGKLGRPKLPPEKKRLASTGFRPTPEVRAKLEAAARENNRSLSSEIESRLERSLGQEEDLYQSFGGKHVYAMARMLAAAVMAAESQTGKRWQEDEETYLLAKGTIEALLGALGPKQSGLVAEKEMIERAEALVLAAKSSQTPAARAVFQYGPDLDHALRSSTEWGKFRERILQRNPGIAPPKSKTA